MKRAISLFSSACVAAAALYLLWCFAEWRTDRAATRALLRMVEQQAQSDMGASVEQVREPATPDAAPPSSGALGMDAGAQPSHADPTVRLGFKPSAVDLLRDASPGFMATPEGLWDATVELWSQPEFLALPGVATVVDAVGLPTEDDCRAALQDGEATRLLENLQILTLALAAMAERGHGERTLLAMDRLRVTALYQLTARLDRVSGYAHWRALAEAYGGWSR